jgi:hypothetical protein
MKCSRCSNKIPTARTDMGYTICVDCSTEEKKVGHIIYPHKTGAYIQVVDKETHANLNRLDRRGSSKKTAKHYKDITISEPKPQRKYVSNYVNKIKHLSYDETLDKVMSYYEEWGYERTLQYLRQLNSSGDIPLSLRVKIQDLVTDRYLQPSPRALSRKFNKQMS